MRKQEWGDKNNKKVPLPPRQGQRSEWEERERDGKQEKTSSRKAAAVVWGRNRSSGEKV